MSAKTDKLLKWMNDLHPDPNDPNNASFFEALKVYKLNHLINIFTIKFKHFDLILRILMKKWFVI